MILSEQATAGRCFTANKTNFTTIIQWNLSHDNVTNTAAPDLKDHVFVLIDQMLQVTVTFQKRPSQN